MPGLPVLLLDVRNHRLMSRQSTRPAPARAKFSGDPHVAWDQFTRKLGNALRRLQDEEFLIIEVRTGGYVQFAGDPDRLYVEAMSLQYILAAPTLRTDARLIAAMESEMGELGWLLPESLPPELVPEGEARTGSPNYSLQWDVPVAFDEAARCAVATLRRVFGARAPKDLQYVAFANAPFASPAFPELGIRRQRE